MCEMKNRYKYGNRCSYNIYYHIILVCKYRKPLLGFGRINQDIIRLKKNISTSNVYSYIENQ